MEIKVLEDTVSGLSGDTLKAGEIIRDVEFTEDTVYIGMWQGNRVSIPVERGAIIIDEHDGGVL